MSAIDPKHYNTGNLECIDAIEASMTSEEFRGFLKGNCMKYLWRAGTKENNPAEQDYAKAEKVGNIYL